MASLSEIQEALTNADAAGRTEDANQLADLYIKMQNETPKTNPNEAGVENLFGDDNGILGDVGNVGARVLAQPAYEGLVTANVVAEAPAFVDQSTENEILVTGIKVVDLLAPYAKGGKIGLFGGAGR